MREIQVNNCTYISCELKSLCQWPRLPKAQNTPDTGRGNSRYKCPLIETLKWDNVTKRGAATAEHCLLW